MKYPVSPLLQNLIYAFILIVIGLIFYSLRPIPILEPRGIFLPSTLTSEAKVKPEDVEILDGIPQNANVLGRISIFRHFNSINPAEIDSILTEEKNLAQRLAAENGGNQVFLMVGRSTGNPNPLDAVMMNGIVLAK